jgi:anti-sigma regulatory factor (Ser/Thr protein kinase)
MARNSEPYEMAAVPASIGEARAIVGDVAAHLPLALRDDAALLVSELMSNAVRHGGATATLTVWVQDGYLTVEVHDDGAGRPAMRSGVLDPAVASGRGLRILDRVAAQWGVEDDHGGMGKTVWFRLAVEQESMSRDEMREDRTVWS